MSELIKDIKELRDKEVEYQKKCKYEDGNNPDTWLFLEGRISALSDILLQYYHFKDSKE